MTKINAKTGAAMMGLAAAGMLASAAPVAAAPAFDLAPRSHVAGVTDITANDHHGRGWREGRGYRRHDYRGGAYGGPVWQGRDGRYYCRRNDGTTGLLIGGAVGGLAGHAIAGRGDRTLGTILGVAGGALLGREIDRSGSRCR